MLNIYADKKKKDLNHYWSGAVFCPTDAIEDDWGQRILDRISEDKALKTIRIFNMLEDIVTLDENGQMQYDFTLNDLRLDYLMSKGFDIMIVYAFIPPWLAADTSKTTSMCKAKTRYKGKVIIPSYATDYGKWEEMCRRYTEHIVERYGEEVVAKWRLLCYNEANYEQYFWADAPSVSRCCEEYCKLYDGFEAGITAVSRKLKIGGPATAERDGYTQFIEQFLQHVKKYNRQLDFISFHSYGTEPELLNSGERMWNITNSLGAIRNVERIRAEQGFAHLPLVNDEWGASCFGFHNIDECPAFIFRETEQYSAYFVKMLALYEELELPLDKMMICLSGQHEMATDFSGFRNFFTLNFYPKPIYNAHLLSSRLGTAKLMYDGEYSEDLAVLPSRHEDGHMSILMAYADGAFKRQLEQTTVTLNISGIQKKHHVRLYRIDKKHANAYEKYCEMGCPDQPTEEQKHFIREFARCKPIEYSDVTPENPMITLEMDNNAVVLVEIIPSLGSVVCKNASEIKSSNWLLGCETLDRDYADYDQYKEYLCPLGIKYLRFQGGWAKTEKEQGVYDWKWLDHIIDDVVSRGLIPWVETAYGNPIYPGAGGETLGAGMPLSKEGMAAYERWVHALVSRYADRVKDWEVWNEPNFGDNKVNTPEITADFNIRTAQIIKGIQPDAKISALALGHIDLEYVERFFIYLSEHNACGLFHNITYHDYVYNPDSNKLSVYKMRQIVEKYAPQLVIRQGENGAPSKTNAGGALADHVWSELSQAKWLTRRMLENLGNDIECSVFSIVDMQYTGNGPITKTNTKGLLESNARNEVIRPKMAYFAVSHVASIFDNTLKRIKGCRINFCIDDTDTDRYWVNTERSIAVYGYEHIKTGKRLYSIWRDEAVPENENRFTYQDFAFVNSRFKKPVLVDIISGDVYDIPKEKWCKEGNMDRFKGIPVYDAPILIAESSLISYR